MVTVADTGTARSRNTRVRMWNSGFFGAFSSPFTNGHEHPPGLVRTVTTLRSLFPQGYGIMFDRDQYLERAPVGEMLSREGAVIDPDKKTSFPSGERQLSTNEKC